MSKPLHSMSLAVADACDCCSEEILFSNWMWALTKLEDQIVPPRGITRSVRLLLREVPDGDKLGEERDAIHVHLARVGASGFGRVDADGVLSIPGVVVAACGNGH